MCVCLEKMEWVSGLSVIICKMGLGLSVRGRVEGRGSDSGALSSRLSGIRSLVSSAICRSKDVSQGRKLKTRAWTSFVGRGHHSSVLQSKMKGFQVLPPDRTRVAWVREALW